MKPDYWLHDIRGKVGKTLPQAFVRNKGSNNRTVKWRQDTVIDGYYEVISTDQFVVVMKLL